MALAIALIAVIFLFFPNAASAVSLDIASFPSTISDQSFDLNVSVSGASAGTNYLRVDLYKDTTFNYFGETYNGSSWYEGSTGTQYFPITIISGQTWNGTIQGKVGTPTSTQFPGSGDYKLKIRRYTNSGNPATSDTQTPKDITITLTSATTTPATTVTPTNTPAITSTTTPAPTISSSFTISSTPSKISSIHSFEAKVNLLLPSNPNTFFYLKGAFKKTDSSNYFGKTLVNSSWVKNGSSYSDQHKITTDSSGNWSGSLDIQPDVSDSGYSKSGSYLFKVARYSNAGSGPIWSNQVEIDIEDREKEEGDEEAGTHEDQALDTIPTKKIERDLSKSIYSTKSASDNSSISGVNTQAPLLVKEEKKKNNNFFIIAGSIFIIIGFGFIVYRIIKFKLK